MFWWLILPIILLVIVLLCAITWKAFDRNVTKLEVEVEQGRSSPRGSRESEKMLKGERLGRAWAKWIGIACVGTVILLEITSSIAMVGTKEVGVVTAFGKPVGEISNGIHLVAPWQDVTELDGAIQTDSVVDDRKTEQCTSTSVRLANQSTACVDNSIRWRINPDSADELFRDYRSFDNIRDSLVTRELNSALNSVMSHFNPLNTLLSGDQINTNLPQLAQDVQKKMQAEIGDQIEVLSVIIPFVGYDPKTQEKINLFQAALANTKIATQEEETALHEAAANKNLAESVSHDPNVLVSKCLGVLDDMVKSNRPVPAGFSCWPGGGSALVVPAAGSSK